MRQTILFSILLLAGCASALPAPVCRHNALMAAVTLGERYPAMVAFGPSSGADWHAQAVVLIDNEWRWVQVRGGKLFLGEKEKFDDLNRFTPNDFYDYIFRGRGEK